MRAILSAVATACVVASLDAQVVINEVNFTTQDQWIELYNPTAADVDIGNLSIYHATLTPNRFGDYWWPFPKGTTIQTKNYLRIHWAAAIVANPPDKRDIYTGDTSWNFLFGHGFEPLSQKQGAIAICKTQENKQVNNPNIFMDWWQWGASGFPRQSIAVNTTPTSLWPGTAFIPVVPDTASIMVLDFLDKLPHPIDAFRFDYSPTPLSANAANMGVTSSVTPCGYNKPSAFPELVADGYPFHGNKDFGLITKNTEGPAYFETIFYVFGLTGALGGWGHCTPMDLNQPHVLSSFMSTETGSTPLDLPLLPVVAKGISVWAHAVVFSPTYWSFSNHLKLQISD